MNNHKVVLDVDPIFRTPRKGGIFHQEVFEWAHDVVVLTNSSSSMRYG